MFLKELPVDVKECHDGVWIHAWLMHDHLDEVEVNKLLVCGLSDGLTWNFLKVCCVWNDEVSPFPLKLW